MATLTSPILSDDEYRSSWDDQSTQDETGFASIIEDYLRAGNALEDSADSVSGQQDLITLDYLTTRVLTSVWAAAAAKILEPVRRTNYNELFFEELAASHPERLIQLIFNGGLRPSDLTFAAETLGRVAEGRPAIRALLALLGHNSSLAREGAIYGLSHRLDVPEVREALALLSVSDPSPGVRDAASDVLAT